MKNDYWIPRKGDQRPDLSFNTVQALIYSISDENGDFSESEFERILSEVAQNYSVTSKMLFKPGHVVFPFESKRFILTGDFWIGQFPVSFEEYDRFCAETGKARPNDYGRGRGINPVTNVSWLDAVEYCNWLSRLQALPPAYTSEGQLLDFQNRITSDITQVAGYRLPVLAEKEYALRFERLTQTKAPVSAKKRIASSVSLTRKVKKPGFPYPKWPDRWQLPQKQHVSRNSRTGIPHNTRGMLFLSRIYSMHCSEWLYDRYNEAIEEEAFDIDSHQKRNFFNPVGRKFGTYHIFEVGKNSEQYGYAHECERNERLTFRLALSYVKGVTPDFSDNEVG
ncbi:MAG TPA: SUMF1/EgtB/PvdO family nonheme iron enzyme [Thermotogota bacterium]|nr:SUMF1/EgtB/PvdO family nonheme iron enzyme [Thermotogota bacterium]